eukprot:3938853-Rhodomonas_salina.2
MLAEPVGKRSANALKRKRKIQTAVATGWLFPRPVFVHIDCKRRAFFFALPPPRGVFHPLTRGVDFFCSTRGHLSAGQNNARVFHAEASFAALEPVNNVCVIPDRCTEMPGGLIAHGCVRKVVQFFPS